MAHPQGTHDRDTILNNDYGISILNEKALEKTMQLLTDNLQSCTPFGDPRLREALLAHNQRSHTMAQQVLCT